MPSASDELRAEWGGSDGIGEDKALAFLEKHGWVEVGNGLMRPPPGRDPSAVEWDAFQFLRDEWDFDLEPKK